jgi:hypothetical protein
MQVINWRGMFLLFETVTDPGPGNLLSGISWTYKKIHLLSIERLADIFISE